MPIMVVADIDRRRPRGPGRFLNVRGNTVVQLNGQLNATLDPLTSIATGQLPIAGALSVTLGSLTATGAGTLPIAGQLSQTLGPLTSTATGTLPIAGAFSQTLGPLTAVGAGNLPIAGTLNQTLGPLTVIGTGSLPVAGTLNQTLGPLTATGLGNLPIAGVLSQTLGPLTMVGTGSLPVAGVLSRTLGLLTGSGAGVLPISGSLGGVLGPLTLSGSGTLLNRGTLNQALGPLVGVGAGTLPIAGILAQTLGPLALVATGVEGTPYVPPFIHVYLTGDMLTFITLQGKLKWRSRLIGAILVKVQMTGSDTMALRRDIRNFVAGDDLEIDVTEPDVPAGTSMVQAWFTVKRDLSLPDNQAIIQKVITTTNLQGTGQITDDGGGDGVGALRFDLTPTDTALLVPLYPQLNESLYQYDIQIKTGTARTYTVLYGTITAIGQVSRAT